MFEILRDSANQKAESLVRRPPTTGRPFTSGILKRNSRAILREVTQSSHSSLPMSISNHDRITSRKQDIPFQTKTGEAVVRSFEAYLVHRISEPKF